MNDHLLINALRQISLCSKNSASSKEECGSIARKALAEHAKAYTAKHIAYELTQTALGNAYFGNALRVAKDFWITTSEDRALLDRYATGLDQGSDYTALQDLANRIAALETV